MGRSRRQLTIIISNRPTAAARNILSFRLLTGYKMKTTHAILLKITSAIITFYLLYLIISVFIYNDYLNSLIPNWHTAIYTMSGALRITLLFGFSAVVSYTLFTLIFRFLTFLWLKAYPVKKK